MLKGFKNFSDKEKLFASGERVLLAVSGGADSRLMCELFFRSGVSFAIAHCNFKLRGRDSDEDEKFCATLAKKYQVDFYSEKFPTEKFARENKLSIQMAARQLRYEWLESVRMKNNFRYVAVAHHADDSVETILLNLVRGTGIAGLHGILPKSGNIIRPLLFASRSEIESYLKTKKLEFRTDQSNFSNDYLRNKIRNQVIPILREINPSLENTFSENTKRLKQAEEVFLDFIREKKKNLLIERNNSVCFSIGKLKAEKHARVILYEVLKEYGFKKELVEKLLQDKKISSGKKFLSDSHLAYKDRDCILISPRMISPEIKKIIKISKENKEIRLNGFKLTFALLKKTSWSDIKKSKQFNNKRFAFLDATGLRFPLLLRKWTQGDYFYPLGMKGKKKLSDFLIDEKVSVPEKEKVYVLCSGSGEIIWVIGKRIDERFCVTELTREVYKIEISQ